MLLPTQDRLRKLREDPLLLIRQAELAQQQAQVRFIVAAAGECDTFFTDLLFHSFICVPITSFLIERRGSFAYEVRSLNLTTYRLNIRLRSLWLH